MAKELFYWLYTIDGEVQGEDYSSKNQTQEAADTNYAEQLPDKYGSMQNGEEFSADIELIAYTYDVDGARKLFTTIKSKVEYMHYHGDLAEHGTWG